jgi:hypothetical protein
MDKKHSFYYNMDKYTKQKIIFVLVFTPISLFFLVFRPEDIRYRAVGFTAEESAPYMRALAFPLIGGTSLLMIRDIWVEKKNKKLAVRLKQDGVRLTAKFTGFENGNIAIKGQGTLKHL